MQNELLDIMAEVILGSLASDMKKCFAYSVIVDKTSNASRVEEVAMYVRFIAKGEVKDCFISFYSAPSTEGSVLFWLI